MPRGWIPRGIPVAESTAARPPQTTVPSSTEAMIIVLRRSLRVGLRCLGDDGAGLVVDRHRNSLVITTFQQNLRAPGER